MSQAKGPWKVYATDELYKVFGRHKSTKVTANLAARLAKAVASFSVIRAILEDIPLGTYRTQVGLELRMALFVNSVLFNCETWHSLTESDLKNLKLIDHQLLRYICSAQAKTPLEFLFLETGSLSLSHIISSRRMNYLFEIITRADSELIKRVYTAQKHDTLPGDFYQQVQKDFDLIGKHYTEKYIQQQSKESYKREIKERIRNAAFEYLQDLQSKHSKVQGIVYKKFETQKYLKSTSGGLYTECKIILSCNSQQKSEISEGVVFSLISQF